MSSRRTSQQQLRVAWFSSCTSTRMLKSAYFSRTIIPQLTSLGAVEVELFASDEDGGVEAAGSTLRSIGSAFHRHLQKPFDLFFYQLEDDPALAMIRRHHALWPGLCLFHDINLNTLHLDQFRFNTGATDLNRAMDEQFGETSARLGDYLVRGWPLEAFDSVYPAGLDTVRSSANVLVGSRSEQIALSRRQIHSSVCPIPVAPVDATRAHAERDALRRMLEVPTQTPVIGFSGGPTLRERAPQLLDAFDRLLATSLLSTSATEPPMLLWIVGPNFEPSAIETFIKRYPGSELRNRQLGVVSASSEAEFAAFHSIPDLFVSAAPDPLRSAPVGLYFALARGIPTVVSSVSAPDLIEADAALGISPGRGEELALAKSLELLLNEPEVAIAIGESARRFIAANNAPEVVTNRLLSAFDDFLPKSRELLAKKKERYATTRSAVLSQAGNSPNADMFVATSCRERFGEAAARDFGWDLTKGGRT